MSELQLVNVSKEYRVRGKGTMLALNNVNLSVVSGRTVALVGQSGSGKSTIAKIVTGLERPTSGQALLDGVPIPHRGPALRKYRQQVRMVFQDPFGSLNPTKTIRYHIERPLKLDHVVPDNQVDAEVMRLLDLVRLDPSVVDRRPHELSGGQRQRVAIARAIASRPSLLIADEPVSMLDVSIRLGVLNLLADLQRQQNLGVLYITHDLATARHFSDEIMVLHHGVVVEQGPSDDVILNPQDDYTKSLLAASPNPDKMFGGQRAGDTSYAPTADAADAVAVAGAAGAAGALDADIVGMGTVDNDSYDTSAPDNTTDWLTNRTAGYTGNPSLGGDVRFGDGDYSYGAHSDPYLVDQSEQIDDAPDTDPLDIDETGSEGGVL